MKKRFLFGLMAIILAGLGLGGVSMAEGEITTFDALKEAIAIANNQEEITLGGNITVTEPIIITKSISINGGEYSIGYGSKPSNWSSSDTNYVFKIGSSESESINVTLSNLHITNSFYGILAGYSASKSTNVILENVSFVAGESYGILFGAVDLANKNATLTVSGTTIPDSILSVNIDGYDLNESSYSIPDDLKQYCYIGSTNLSYIKYFCSNSGETINLAVSASSALGLSTPVAKIDNVYYGDLQNAITDANESDTITLLKDVESTAQITIDKPLTLDGGNHTLTVTHSSTAAETAAGILVVGTNNVTIKNIKVDGPNKGEAPAWVSNQHVIKVYNSNDVTIENVEVNHGSEAMHFNGSTVTLKGNITVGSNCTYGGFEAKNSTITIDGDANIAETVWIWDNDGLASIVTGEGWNKMCKDDSETCSEYQWWQSEFTITKAEVSNGTITISAEKAIKGTEITLTATPASNYNFGSWTVKDSDNGAITVTDNKFIMPAKNVTVSATFTKKSSGGGSSSSSSSSSSSNKTGNNNTGATAESGTTADSGVNTPTVDPQGVAANGYTNEMNEAYEFAYANGITTMKSIDEAEMLDGLTRIAMAKMLSQYAINVLGKSPADVEVPNFTDVSADLDAEYANGVSLAYKLGIMGINMPDNKFLPYETVTRAQFGTALSRLLFGIEDGEDAYYTTHLAKLKEAGIITNDDPTLEELRGYVMLMLMRSSKK